jgi:hypothetical protein
MMLLEPTLLALARAGVIALATLALLLLAGRGLLTPFRGLRSALFWIAMFALLAPGFASGFIQYDRAMKSTALGRECFYAFLVLARFFWLAVLALWLVPPSIARQGLHIMRTGVAPSFWRRVRWELRAWGRGLWLGVGLVFLLAFQEFELATTWNLRAWTVALFDAQAGGYTLGASLQLAALPFGIEVVLLGFMALGMRSGVAPAESDWAMDGRVVGVLGCAFFGACALYVPHFMSILLSLVSLRQRGVEVFGLVPWREMANAAGLAAVAATLAWLVAGWVVTRRGWRWLLVLPGLMGPLLCGLLLLAMLRVPGIDRVRDTVFTPAAGLVLWMLPLAVLLRVGHEATQDRPALHTARLAGSRRALWRLQTLPRLVAALLLFGVAYGDFTVNSLLAPPQFTSVSVRLLNLLHYGRSEALGAMFAFAWALPVSAALLTVLAVRFYARRRAC